MAGERCPRDVETAGRLDGSEIASYILLQVQDFTDVAVYEITRFIQGRPLQPKSQ
jgi:hypothetical protein